MISRTITHDLMKENVFLELHKIDLIKKLYT